MKRYSKQRETILNILRNTTRHPTASVIYECARQVIPNISLGTVYRNLSQLTQSGDILALKALDGSEHFDANFSPHPHLHCKCCGEVIDLQIPFVGDFVKKASEETGCVFEGHSIMFYGKCNLCKKTN